MSTIDAQLDTILREFMEEMGEDTESVFKTVGKDTVTLLKRTSPKKKGKYSSGWASKVTGHGLKAELVIYNRLKPGLTHLLENGHVIIDRHGMNKGRARAIKHIEPAEQQATNEMLERLSK